MSSFQLSIFGTPSTGSSSSGSNPLASIFNESTLQKYARVYKPTEVEKKVAEKKEDDEALITGGKKKRKKKLLELEAARAKAAADLAAETNGTVAEDEKEQAVEEEQSQSNKKAKKDNNKKPPVVAVKEIGPAIIATEEKKVNKKTKQNEQQQQQTTQQVTKDDETDEHALNDAEATSTPGLEVSEKNSDRTLFVGNIPLKETVKSITKLFTDYGTVESCRMRSVPIAGAKVDEAGNQKLVKKVCVNSQKFGEQKGSYNAYIVYKDTDAVSGADSVKTAITAMNNKLLGDRHLRVDSATPTLFDPKRTVFVGGLPYYADEEEVRKFFSEVLDGPEDISGIRLVRDPETLVGKGIGYILFKDRECVGKALSRHEVRDK
jgi:nucleolar protein 12